MASAAPSWWPIGSSIRYACRAPGERVASSLSPRLGDAGRHAQDDTRVREPMLAVPPGNELNRASCSVTSKLGDHAVSLSGRIAWIVPGVWPSTALRFDADGVDFAGAHVDRDLVKALRTSSTGPTRRRACWRCRDRRPCRVRHDRKKTTTRKLESQPLLPPLSGHTPESWTQLGRAKNVAAAQRVSADTGQRLFAR